jgi:hypothetical protein
MTAAPPTENAIQGRSEIAHVTFAIAIPHQFSCTAKPSHQCGGAPEAEMRGLNAGSSLGTALMPENSRSASSATRFPRGGSDGKRAQ